MHFAFKSTDRAGGEKSLTCGFVCTNPMLAKTYATDKAVVLFCLSAGTKSQTSTPNFLMKGKNTFHLFEQTPPKWTPKFGRFRKKFKKFFKNTLHYICTGRGQFVGCFAKKFKIAFTYSHWEKAFAHPNSELFTKSLKIPFTYSHREKEFVRPDSEMFTKD